MKTSFDNSVFIEGYLYEHKLKIREITNTESASYGQSIISGTIEIATDESAKNIIPISYNYVAPTWKSGKTNGNYTILKRIIDENPTILNVGVEKAMKLKVPASVGVNDFYSDRTGTPELVSARILEGGFLSIIGEFSSDLVDMRARGKCECVLSKSRVIDADPEKNVDADYVELSGYCFGYGLKIIPVVFKARLPRAVDAFRNNELSASNPMCGVVTFDVLHSFESYKIVKEGLFGDIVEEKTRKVNELTCINIDVYEPGMEGSYPTPEELTGLLQTRETHLAEVKQRYVDAQKAKAATPVSIPSGPAAVAANSEDKFVF